MGGGRIFPKNLRASVFNDDLLNEPIISARSISLDSTFETPTIWDQLFMTSVSEEISSVVRSNVVAPLQLLGSLKFAPTFKVQKLF